MYRGPAVQYRVRKTTVNNKTGDSYAITVPRIVAETFTDSWFRLLVSGGCLIFESGCKVEPEKKGVLMFDTEKENHPKRIFFSETSVEFD